MIEHTPAGDPLSVGALARRVGLTAKALRHYDRIGLLHPANVDASGPRWYTSAQVPTARRVAVLRSVGVPLDDVRRCLADTDLLSDVLGLQRRRLQAHLVRVQRQLHSLTHLIDDGLDEPMPNTDPGLDDAAQERLARTLFNLTWTLLEAEERTRGEDDAMVHMAHASRHHWGQLNNVAAMGRGEWQCSRVCAALGRPEPCLHHAQRYLDLCREHGIGDWDLAFAYEALARGHAVAGDLPLAREFTEQALAACEDVTEDENRELVLSDLESIPGQPRFW